MNVLILSASAKVLLVRAFKAATNLFGGRVFACDSRPDSSALFAADSGFIFPKDDDPAFETALFEVCRSKNIRLVVPTRDGELVRLAEIAERLRHETGAVALASSPERIDICLNKKKFTNFCINSGFPIPRQYVGEDSLLDFPFFSRPIFGAGGTGSRIIRNLTDLRMLESGPECLIQEFVSDPEFSIDVLMDFCAAPIQSVARRRLEVKAGESVKSRVEQLDDLCDRAEGICASLGLIGHITVQAFYSELSGARFIEVNPRFGGASNLSIRAGLESPARLLQLLAGQEDEALRKRPIHFGLTMLRHAEDVIVNWNALEAEFAYIGKASSSV